jgi:hypothetical protein
MSRTFFGPGASTSGGATTESISIPSRPLYGPTSRHLAGGDFYIRVLSIVVLVFAICGHNAAYIGVHPIYISEFMLAAGLWVLLEAGTLSLVLNSAPALFLLLFIVWGVLRTVPYVGTYGSDAFRDGAIFGYGLFAFVVAGLLLQSPVRLVRLLLWYRKFIWLLLFVGTPFFLMNILWYLVAKLPTPFNYYVWLIMTNKCGDFAVHISGAFIFLTVLRESIRPASTATGLGTGNARPFVTNWLPIIMILIDLGMTMYQRAASVTFLLVAAITTLAKPKSAFAWRLWSFVGAGVLILAVSGIRVPLNEGRELSFDQLSNNVKSILGVGKVDTDQLDGTKKWRLDWWKDIVQYTFQGKYFWTGKGFGINLADDDGRQVNRDGSLRSPHNGHMTILARSGVPGLALWVLLNVTWAGAMLDGFFRARRARQDRWSGVFIFLIAYWAAHLTNASFDVFLEGPIGGVWFWTIFGTGLALQHLYRLSPELLATGPEGRSYGLLA